MTRTQPEGLKEGMRAGRTKLLTEIAVVVALATVLGFLRLYRLPWGGSLSLKILPLLILSLRRGPRAGALAGGLTGAITLILDPFILHPIQVGLDYFLPYVALGLTGYFAALPRMGIALTGFVRLTAHVLSGVVYFAAYAPPNINVETYEFLSNNLGVSFPWLLQAWTAPWVYSFLYNGSVVIPETVIMVVIVPLLILRLQKTGLHR